MIRLEDYTQLPQGFVAPLEGRVDRCPCCGRNGIEEHPSLGAPYFLHIQVSEVLPDGMRDEPVDSCALPLPN